MAWTITDRFPSWGESGEFPAAGFFYEGGDQVNEKHLDALWNGLKNQEDELQAALTDIDADQDGVVDEADTVTSGGNLKGDLLALNGEIIWDESAGYIPQGRLQNDSVSTSFGAGITGDGSVTLGGTLSLNFDETVIKDGNAKEIDAAEFSGDSGVSGNVLTTDGTSASWGTLPPLLSEGDFNGTNTYNNESFETVTFDPSGTVDVIHGVASFGFNGSGTVTFGNGNSYSLGTVDAGTTEGHDISIPPMADVDSISISGLNNDCRLFVRYK